MARPWRIEYPGAIHHVISRGDHRRSVFEDDRDYQRLLERLERTVRQFDWELLSFVLIPNPCSERPSPTCPGACSTSSPATSFCLAGAGADAGDPPGVVRGLRADASQQRA